MLEEIQRIINEISGIEIRNLDELESFRLNYLSKKGIISNLFE